MLDCQWAAKNLALMAVFNISFDHGSAQSCFLAPVETLLEQCRHRRQCASLTDGQWLRAGILRVLQAADSGRGFLQQFAPCLPPGLGRGLFFAALHSPRRRDLCAELSRGLFQKVPPADDPFASIKALGQFDLYAADGHRSGASAHEPPIDGRKWAVGQFYCINLRSKAMAHLASALDGGRREHDMHALKRLGAKTLRQDAPKGRKVLYAYDCAGIDFSLWHYWKQQAGIYFVSRAKENMRLETLGINDYDRGDAVNAGVLGDELAGTSQHVLVRRIIYKDPASGQDYEFITSEMSLPPGVICYIYRRRWDIEKTFDQCKNKLGQTHAWGAGQAARDTQAHFICICHNLLLILEERLTRERQISNEAEHLRRKQRLDAQRRQALARKCVLPSLVETCRRLTQASLKFIRWLRACFLSELPLAHFLPALRRLYQHL
jgi:hypothetical protein